MKEHPPTLAEQMEHLREAVRECGHTLRDTPGFWLYVGGVWLTFLAFAVISTLLG